MVYLLFIHTFIIHIFYEKVLLKVNILKEKKGIKKTPTPKKGEKE